MNQSPYDTEHRYAQYRQGDTAQPFDRVNFVMPRELYDKMMAYVQLCPVEINGLGVVTRSMVNGVVTLRVEDIFITQQTASMAHAGVTGEVLAKVVYDFLQAGKNPETIHLQWHSHVFGPTEFSDKDIRTIETAYVGCDWMISLVVNKFGDRDARLDVFEPFRSRRRLSMIIDNGQIDPAVVQACSDDIKSMVTQTNRLRQQRPVVRRQEPVPAVRSLQTGMVVSAVGEGGYGDGQA